MSQLRAETEKETYFQLRIMGSKSILVPSTFAVEMIIDIENSCTRWVVHKSRYAESMGKDFKTGYDRGRFVEYTSQFAEQVQKRAYLRENNRIDKATEIVHAVKETPNKEKEDGT
jgi:hypothetical protein